MDHFVATDNTIVDIWEDIPHDIVDIGKILYNFFKDLDQYPVFLIKGLQ